MFAALFTALYWMIIIAGGLFLFALLVFYPVEPSAADDRLARCRQEGKDAAWKRTLDREWEQEMARRAKWERQQALIKELDAG